MNLKKKVLYIKEYMQYNFIFIRYILKKSCIYYAFQRNILKMYYYILIVPFLFSINIHAIII